jgi:hypothetical protein
MPSHMAVVAALQSAPRDSRAFTETQSGICMKHCPASPPQASILESRGMAPGGGRRGGGEERAGRDAAATPRPTAVFENDLTAESDAGGADNAPPNTPSGDSLLHHLHKGFS